MGLLAPLIALNLWIVVHMSAAAAAGCRLPHQLRQRARAPLDAARSVRRNPIVTHAHATPSSTATLIIYT
jgi:hypothetical protein